MNYLRILKRKLKNYLEISTLHGLKYIGKSSSTTTEKLFWTVSFITASVFSLHFIGKIIDNYNSRVIVSLNAITMSAFSVPFPTLTICNMNRANKDKVEAIVRSGSAQEQNALREFCNDYDFVKGGNKEEKLSKDYLINFTQQISPSCKETILICYWKNKKFNCSDIFSSVITDVGMCCVFNQLSLNDIFRESSKSSNNNNYVYQDWNFEKGYEGEVTNKTIPFRLKGPGLFIVLNANLQSTTCSSSNSIGFKVLMGNPVEMSRVRSYGIHIPTGFHSVISMRPTIAEAKKTLKHESYENRWCYFNDERYLKFFKTYTLKNCLVECNINYTVKLCHCMPYYMISESNIDACNYEHLECRNKIQENVAFYEKPFHNKSECNCLPNCNEYAFKDRISYNRLNSKQLLYLSNKGIISENVSNKIVIDNIALVKLYYEMATIERSSKNDIYDIFEFLSNMGGLLCIFLGFSFLSVAEIIYHLLCKFLPIIIQVVGNKCKSQKLQPFTK